MAFANVVSVATGSLAKEDARAVTQGWLRAAYPNRDEQPVRATPEMLRAAGIGVRRVPKKVEPRS